MPLAGRHIVIIPAWWPSPEDPLAGVFFQDYARMFADAGAKVGVIYPDLVSPRKLGRAAPVSLIPRTTFDELGAVNVVRIRGLHTALGRPWLQMQRFRRWLRRGLAAYAKRFGRPHFLHAMCAIPSGWACTHLTDPLAKHVIITEHTGPFSLALTPGAAAPFVFEAIRKASHVVAVSATLRAQMQEAGVKREIRVIGNPVASEFVRAPIDLSTWSSEEARPLNALFVGRLVPEKGVRELIDAASRLAGRLNIHWHLVGGGPQESEIAQTVARLNLQDRVTLHGPLDRAVVCERMAEADFFVDPSHGETFGLSFAEALCMGLPFVATDVATQPLSPRPEDGVLCKPGSAADLAAGIESLISKGLRENRTARAELYRGRFASESVAASYAKLFSAHS